MKRRLTEKDMNRIADHIVNQLEEQMAFRDLERMSNNAEPLEGAAYIEKVEKEGRLNNALSNRALKEIDDRFYQLDHEIRKLKKDIKHAIEHSIRIEEKKIKELKKDLKIPNERLIRVEEKVKKLGDEYKESKKRDKNLEKRVSELEELILMIANMSDYPIYCDKISDLNNQMKRHKLKKVKKKESGTITDLNMIDVLGSDYYE